MDYHIKVTIPLFNVENWIQRCIRSVKIQKFKNFQCVLVDDISNDNSVTIINKEIKNDSRFKLITNDIKSTAVKNIEKAIDYSKPSPDDIIVNIDGDDWLSTNDVFDKIINVYNKNNCWMTYGSYIIWPENIKGHFAQKVPDHIIENQSYRDSPWMTSHLRTYKYKLWEKIDKDDFIYKATGKPIKATADQAFMFPMLEMSGHKAVYIEDILYVYNRENTLNEDKIDHPYQLKEESYIRNKPRYKLLNNL